jgi:hypothetical protein
VIPYSGGRVFLTMPLSVTPGARYCMTVWIRGTNTSCDTQPFIGINGQWLVGQAGFGTPYIAGGTVVPVNANGAWNWYAAPFTAMDPTLEIMDEIFNAGGAGSADFDDIRIYAGSCPATPVGAPHACPPPEQACPCALNSDCNANAPVCNAETTRCGRCTRDADCAGRSGLAACNTTTGACVACTTANAAACTGATPACNPTSNTCVQCTEASAAACTGATPACNVASSTCVQCTAANARACSGATPVCGAANTCVACTAGGAGAAGAGCDATANGRACLSDTMGRAFCGCATDADCGGATSGRVCDVTARRCVDGCSPAMGRNGCPEGQFCSSDDVTGMRAGMCTTTCNFDGDCARTMPMAPRCLPADDAGTSRCVACRADSDCAARTDGRLLCAPESHTCVACTAMMTGACRAEASGAACLTDGTCGCATDSDCGGATSGRVCDAMTRACVAGCRAMGGNGCPMGMVCDAAGDSPGRCAAAPDAAPDVSPDVAADVSLDVAEDVSPDVTADVAPDAGPTPMDAPNDLAAVDASGPNDVNAPPNDTPAPPADVASEGPNTGEDKGGCGCSTPPTRASNGAVFALAAAAFAAIGRRSGRRRSR